MAAYWQLGNTPFDRAAIYRQLLEDPLPRNRVEVFMAAARRGWAVGTSDFAAQLEAVSLRPMSPRPRGRPPKVGGAASGE
jgi:putative transposase